jgi:hypothetical protein
VNLRSYLLVDRLAQRGDVNERVRRGRLDPGRQATGLSALLSAATNEVMLVTRLGSTPTSSTGRDVTIGCPDASRMSARGGWLVRTRSD